MDCIFGALSVQNQNAVIRLSKQLIDELLALATLGPLAAVDLRAPFAEKLVATDACLSGIAAVEAKINQQLSGELCRASLTRGRWTKLLAPSDARAYNLGAVIEQVVTNRTQRAPCGFFALADSPSKRSGGSRSMSSSA